jgi:hypothetical protein
VISNRIPLLVFGRRAHLVTGHTLPGHRIVEPHHPPSKQEYLYNTISKSRSIRYSIILEYFNNIFNINSPINGLYLYIKHRKLKISLALNYRRIIFLNDFIYSSS